jgi:hypothetical protein
MYASSLKGLLFSFFSARSLSGVTVLDAISVLIED